MRELQIKYNDEIITISNEFDLVDTLQAINTNKTKLFLIYELKYKYPYHSAYTEILENKIDIIYDEYIRNDNYKDIITYFWDLIKIIEFNDENLIDISIDNLFDYMDEL